jgi:hypothetical protein
MILPIPRHGLRFSQTGLRVGIQVISGRAKLEYFFLAIVERAVVCDVAVLEDVPVCDSSTYPKVVQLKVARRSGCEVRQGSLGGNLLSCNDAFSFVRMLHWKRFTRPTRFSLVAYAQRWSLPRVINVDDQGRAQRQLTVEFDALDAEIRPLFDLESRVRIFQRLMRDISRVFGGPGRGDHLLVLPEDTLAK